MSKNLSELCVLLMRDMYGEVSARVVDMLLKYGRTSLHSLVRRVKLPERIVKQNMVVLIQQHLVLHFPDPQTDVVHYECNWRQVYEILHVGRIVRATQERFGEDGASVISNVLLLGHIMVSDFITACGFSTRPKANNLTNGANGTATVNPAGPSAGPIGSITRLKQVIVQLLKEKYLVRVLDVDMQPESDALSQLDQKYRQELTGTTSTKIALENAISDRIKEHLDGLEDERLGLHSGLKRKSSGFSGGRPQKRMRMMNEDDDDADGDGWDIDENMVLRVNHDKFLMLFRNAQIVKCVEGRISRATSLVLAEMLRILEKRQFGCKNLGLRGAKNHTVTTFEINKTLNADLNLNKAIAYAEAEAWVEVQTKNNKKRALSNGNGANGSLTNGNGHVDTDEDDDDDDDDGDNDGMESEDDPDNPEAKERRKRLYQIKDHMLLLANDALKFVKNVSNRSFGEWEIDYGPIMESIRRIEMENIIEDSRGSIAVRLTRILRDKGKLDEKLLGGISLLKQQEIRHNMSNLHKAGFVELQEVPRFADRAPTKTIFLFFYDDKKAQARLLERMYKGMSRIIERVAHERRRHDVLLEKAERTDVVGNEDELLTEAEKKEMEGWKGTQERLLGQLFRLDTQVMLFRDW